VTGPFAFGSGVTLTGPIPNPGLHSGAIVGDFVIDPASFSLVGNGDITSAAQVPFGSAYLAMDDPTDPVPIELSFATSMLRVGAYVTGASGAITLTTFDTVGAVIESTTLSSVTVSQWGDNFIGLENTSGIAKVQFSGDYIVLDGLTFEPVPAPGAAALAMIGVGLLHRRRRVGRP